MGGEWQKGHKTVVHVEYVLPNGFFPPKVPVLWFFSPLWAGK